MSDTPRQIRPDYHPDRLLSLLSLLFGCSIIGAALGVAVGVFVVLRSGDSYSSTTAAGVEVGWAIAGRSLLGLPSAAGLALARAVLRLLAETRDATVHTHNLLGEQAPAAKSSADPTSAGRRYSVGQDGQVETAG